MKNTTRTKALTLILAAAVVGILATQVAAGSLTDDWQKAWHRYEKGVERYRNELQEAREARLDHDLRDARRHVEKANEHLRKAYSYHREAARIKLLINQRETTRRIEAANRAKRARAKTVIVKSRKRHDDWRDVSRHDRRDSHKKYRRASKHDRQDNHKKYQRDRKPTTAHYQRPRGEVVVSGRGISLLLSWIFGH